MPVRLDVRQIFAPKNRYYLIRGGGGVYILAGSIAQKTLLAKQTKHTKNDQSRDGDNASSCVGYRTLL